MSIRSQDLVGCKEGSSFQEVNNTCLYEVGAWSRVLIREVSSFQKCPLKEIPLY